MAAAKDLFKITSPATICAGLVIFSCLDATQAFPRLNGSRFWGMIQFRYRPRDDGKLYFLSPPVDLFKAAKYNNQYELFEIASRLCQENKKAIFETDSKECLKSADRPENAADGKIGGKNEGE